LKIGAKSALLVAFSVLHYAAWAVAIAWLCRPGDASVLHWGSWTAALEASCVLSALSICWWIYPLFSGRSRRLWLTAVLVAFLSACSMGCYVAMLFVLGPNNSLLATLAAPARLLLVSEGGIFLVVLAIPPMAILSGVLCWIMLAVERRR
jgi:hypothetical protein